MSLRNDRSERIKWDEDERSLHQTLECLASLTNEVRQRFYPLLPMAFLQGDWENSANAREDVLVKFMLMAQYEHLISVSTLIENGHHRDAGIIARASLEGVVHLLWLQMPEPSDSQNESSRVDLWFCSLAVIGWRHERNMIKSGTQLDDDELPDLERRLARWGNMFYKSGAKRAIAKNQKPAEDPFREGWEYPKISTTDKFKQVESHYWPLQEARGPMESELPPLSLLRAWESFSDWTHYNPIAILRVLDERDRGVGYYLDDPLEALIALSWTLHSFLIVAEAYCKRLDPKLNKVVQEFMHRQDRCWPPSAK